MINDVPRGEQYGRAIASAVLQLSQRPPELATPTVPRFSCARVAAGGGSKTMPHFTMEQVRSLMDQTEKIRSLSIIAHVDHGKTTLADSLISRAGIISAKVAGEARFTHGRKDEQERGVTIKSTGVTLCFEHDEDGHSQPYLVNLIDSPGHVDFSSEVTAALRITDGAIVVVDCIEGCAVQTETVLRQALQERVKPCLFVNKVDRCILEMQMDAEDMYLRFRTAIENVNVIIATYNDASMGDLQVRPEAGNVAFGSGLHGWGFGVEHFAKMLSAKTGGNKSRMMEKLWGDWFYHPKKKLWTNVQHPEDCQEPLQRGFCQYIMNPINQLIRAIVDKDSERYEKMMERLGIVLKGEEKTLTGKQLMKHVMQNWINAGDSLVSMIVNLPSPKVAQRYRVENLYDGPMDDDAAMGIRNCNPQGPLMMYVSKMVPADKSRFFAFGRVFSGTVATGQKVRIQGPHYKPGTKEDLHVKAIQRTVIMMGRGSELIQDVPCGNTVALAGVDQYILKSGTITTLEDAHNFTDMKYSVSPVVKVAVKPKDGKDLPKLVEGMKKLSKSDQLVVCSVEESGEHVIAGCGELHVEICLKDLREEFAQCDFTVSDPVVSYRETVTETSSQTCLAKSANKHNRLYFTAEPLDSELVQAIEEGSVGPADPKEAAKILSSKFGWDKQAAQKIWCFGPECEGPNMVVDSTIGAQYLQDIKDSVGSAFQWATKQGPLCEENMRGIRFNLTEVLLHPDKVHRGGGQVMPAVRRCCFASELTAKPTLQEPVFLVEISCPKESLSGIYNCLNLRRGCVFEENQREGTPLVQVKAHLPVSESFGFVSSLRQATSGQAFPQCVFDHWESLPGNCLEKGSKMEELVLSIRKRKNLKLQMPLLSDYLDKL
ncbi:Elongation factor 2 (EF-2) [Durusdinium trenchii]